MGQPRIALAQNVIFAIGDTSRPLGQVRLEESVVAGVIQPEWGIRLLLPEGFAGQWDTSVGSVQLSGTQSRVVSDSVVYEEAGQALRLTVHQAFEAGGGLAIDGLRLTGFDRGVSSRAGLRLQVGPGGVDQAVSDGTVQVANPRLVTVVDQGFVVGDGLVTSATIQVIEDPQVAGITARSDLRLRLPDGLAWNAENLQLTMRGSGQVAEGGLSGLLDGLLYIEVERDFSRGDTLLIEGMQMEIDGVVPRSQVELSVHEQGRWIPDEHWVAVGQPRLTSSRDHAFHLQSGQGRLGPIALTEDSAAAAITPAQGLQLILPEATSARWGIEPGTTRFDLTAPVQLSGSAAARIEPTAEVDSTGRVLRLRVQTPFEAGDALILDQLPIHFDQTAPPVELQLRVTQPTVDANDSRSLRVGATNIILPRNVVFAAGDSSRALGQVGLEESVVAGVIQPEWGIRLLLPEGFAGQWDTSVSSVRLSGAERDAVSDSVVYEEDGQALRLTVHRAFEAGGGLAIDGLRLTGFDRGVSPRAGLRLQVGPGGVDQAVSDSTVRVANPRLVTVVDQGFAVGDGLVTSVTIQVIEDPQVAGITARSDLRLRLPDGLAWNDDNLQLIMRGSGLVVDTLENYIVSRNLYIEVERDFSRGDTLLIEGMQMEIDGVVPRSQVELSVHEQGRWIPDEHWVAVGQPRLTSSRDHAFHLQSGQGRLGPIALTEDSAAAAITPAQGLQLILPEATSARWGIEPGTTRFDLTAPVQLSGSAAARIEPTAEVDSTGRVLRLRVQTPFEAGDALILDQLPIHFDQTAPPVELQLRVTQPTVDANDSRSLRVGNPSISAQITQSRNTLFVVGDPPRTLPSIIIQEDSAASFIVDGTVLDLVLPNEFNGRWKRDAGGTVDIPAGPDIVIGAESYQDDKRLRIVLETTLNPAENISINRLQVEEFTGASQVDSVRVDLVDQNISYQVFPVQIGAPTLISSLNQSFVVGMDQDGQSITAAPITIRESPVSPSIIPEEGIRVILPDSLAMEWGGQEGLQVLEGDRDKIGTIRVESPKVLFLEVVEPFSRGETLILDGLRLTNFTSVSDRDYLSLSVNGGISVNSQDPRFLRVGQPTLTSVERQRLIAGTLSVEAWTLFPITITENEEAGSIDSVFALEIPPSFGATWANTTPTIRGPAQLDREASDETTLVFRTDAPFAGGQNIVLEGLAFTPNSVPSAPDNLILSINGAGREDARDEAVKWIGGAPSISMGEAQIAVVGDVALPLEFTIRDDANNPSLIQEEGIELQIPVGTNAQWVAHPDSLVFAGDAADWVQRDSVVIEGPRLIVPLSDDFAADQSLVIRAYIHQFSQIAQPAPFALSAMADFNRHSAKTPQQIRVGAPQLSSAEDQVFIAGRDHNPNRLYIVAGDTIAGPAPCALIEIRENSLVPVITQRDGIRLSLPDTLEIEWLATDTIQVMGTAVDSGRVAGAELSVVAGSLIFDPDGKTLIIPVNEDFGPGEYLTLSNLRLQGFSKPARRDSLRLSVNAGRSTVIQDDKSKRVGKPVLSTGGIQRFAVGEDGILAAPLIVSEDSVEAAITTDRGMQIHMADDLEGHTFAWRMGDAILPSGNAADKVQGIDVQEGGQWLDITVREDFAPGDTLIIRGLRYGKIDSVAQVDSLFNLVVKGNVDDVYDAKSAAGMKIGNPLFSSSGDRVFSVGDTLTPVALHLVEDATVSLFQAGDTLHFDVPTNVPFGWFAAGDSIWIDHPRVGPKRETANLPFPQLSLSEKVGIPLYDPTRKRVSIRVTQDWLPGDSLSIAGLYLGNFTARGATNLVFGVSLPDTSGSPAEVVRAERVDTNRITVAGLTLLSEAEQAFLVGDSARIVSPIQLRTDPDSNATVDWTSLHLFIPQELHAQWDSARTGLVLAEDTKIDTVVFASAGPEDDSLVEAIIQLVAPLAPGEILDLDGLWLRDFTEVSKRVPLALSVNKGATVAVRDRASKRIGEPKLIVRDLVSRAFGLEDTMVFLADSVVYRADTSTPLETEIYPLGIAASPIEAGLVVGDTLTVEIPTVFQARWANQQTPLFRTTNGSDSLPDKLALLPEGAVSENGKLLRLLVGQDFAPGDTAYAEGLRFAGFEGTSADTSLILRSGRAFRKEAAQKMRIGAPFISTGDDKVFAKGDPNSQLSIVIGEDAVPALVGERDVRLVLPDSLGLAWDTRQTQTDRLIQGTAAAKVAAITYEKVLSDTTAKIMVLELGQNLAPRDSLRLNNIRVVVLPQSSKGNLALLPLDDRFPVLDPAILLVGTSTIASAQDQAFVSGDLPTPLYPITIIEDRTVTTIKSSQSIRIVLPANLLRARWNTDADSLLLAGKAADKIQAIVHFNGDTLIIPVEQDFDPGDTLVIQSGLEWQSFGLSPPARLGLVVTESGFVQARDTYAKWVGQPTIATNLGRAFPLDETPVLGDERGARDRPVRLSDIRIVESGLGGTITGERDILLTWADSSSLKPYLEWDLTDAVAQLNGVRLDMETIDTDRDTVRIDIHAAILSPEDEVMVSGLGLRVKDQVYASDLGALVNLLPLQDHIGLIVHGTQPFVRAGGQQVANPNRGRLVHIDATPVSLFLPVLFDNPRIFTQMAGGLPSTWVGFHTIPGLLDTTGLVPSQFPIFPHREAIEGLPSADAAGRMAINDTQFLIQGRAGVQALSMWEVKMPLLPDQVRQLNKWYDDSFLDSISIGPEMRLSPAGGLQIMQKGGLAPMQVDPADLEESHRTRLDYLGLIEPGEVRFPLDNRYFNPKESSKTTVEGLAIFKGESSTAKWVEVRDFAGSKAIDPSKVTIGVDNVVLDGIRLEEGVNELALYFARSGSDTLSFPIIRQVVIDTTAPRIAQLTAGNIGPPTGREDTIEKPQPLRVVAESNRLRPLPVENQSILTTLLDTLNTVITDNIVLLSSSSDAPESAGVLDIVRNGKIQRDSLYFRMPLLEYPILLELEARRTDDLVILPRIEDLPIADRTALTSLMGLEQRSFGVEPIHVGVDQNKLQVGFSLPLGIELDPGHHFAYPLMHLPAKFQQNNMQIKLWLSATDRAGNKAFVRGGEPLVYTLITEPGDELVLEQLYNFPNPFTSVPGLSEPAGTSIRFVLAPASVANLSVFFRVFDASGQQIYAADLHPLRAGENMFQWDGRNVYGQPLASGVYFGILEVVGADKKDIGKWKIAVLNR
ncbi:MAG: hypothetical protein GKR89_36925 [Candidatus Latescibacteria bacterium]|nr:hypothetical protein [Candidatus Latescibacterota bacterium]